MTRLPTPSLLALLFVAACSPGLDNAEPEPEAIPTALQAGTIVVHHPDLEEVVFDGFYVEHAPSGGHATHPELRGGTGLTWELFVDPAGQLAEALDAPAWILLATAPHGLSPDGAFHSTDYFMLEAETQLPDDDGYQDWVGIEAEEVSGNARLDDGWLTATYELFDTNTWSEVLVDVDVPLGRPDGPVDEGDTDGDGIANYIEQSGPEDLDGDGIPSAEDSDSDGDGIEDGTETAGDQDGDGLPDCLDSDTDADGIPDSFEGAWDSDGDGEPDYRDLDSDGDGILDAWEMAQDIDGDGIPNYLDEDSDGDGVPDSDDEDYDGDGLSNGEEWGDTFTDSDGDGVMDPFDAD
jgi:hypothetical protein